MKHFVVILVVLIEASNIMCAQTETPILLPDSLKIYDNKHITPQNDLRGILESPFPMQLPATIEMSYPEHKVSKLNSDTANSRIIYLRDLFRTNGAPLFGKIEDGKNQEIKIKLRKEDLYGHLTFEWQFNMQTLRWELMPKSTMATGIGIGTIIEWIKRIFRHD